MDELIIAPNESIILQPGEGVFAGRKPLRIRGPIAATKSPFECHERTLWKTLRQATGNQIALYRRGEESRIVCVVPETAQPASFDLYEDENNKITLTTTSRIFKLCKADLGGWLPKHGDTLEYAENPGEQAKIYKVQMTGGPHTYYLDVGNHGVMIRILVDIERGKESPTERKRKKHGRH
jgi:hypothetical protein